jgi:hypothetical protein
VHEIKPISDANGPYIRITVVCDRDPGSRLAPSDPRDQSVTNSAAKVNETLSKTLEAPCLLLPHLDPNQKLFELILSGLLR